VRRHDLLVIGAGPGGYTAAIRAAQLGMDVACVDENEAAGGTCLRVGCIPSKALLESSELYARARAGFGEHGIALQGVELDLAGMHRRKERIVQGLAKGIDSLFAKNKVTRYTGRARFIGPGRVLVAAPAGTFEVAAERILIATGSRPAALPGFDLAGGVVATSTEALSFERVPERLVVIGGGYIGVELGSVWSRLGSQVTVVELADRILPGMDREIAGAAQRLLARQGLRFLLGARVIGARRSERGEVEVHLAGGERLHCDQVLLAVGRAPNTEGLGLEEAGVTVDERGFIEVDHAYRTQAPGVYAVGDVIGGPMLAHKAEREGIACVEGMAGRAAVVNYAAIPAVVYTDPEIAAVGPTEEELAAAGRAYRVGRFPFRANGRARCLGASDGFVKVLAEEGTDRLLGVHIIGPRAGELIAEAAAAIEFGASSEDLAHVVHPHPTLSEAIKEAALAAHDRPIHL